MAGSHGSLTKAGKVKSSTPKVARTGVNSHSKKCPRMRNRSMYLERIVCNHFGGQANSMAAQKHKRATGQDREDRPRREGGFGSRRREEGSN
jgi:ribosomal protein S30